MGVDSYDFKISVARDLFYLRYVFVPDSEARRRPAHVCAVCAARAQSGVYAHPDLGARVYFPEFVELPQGARIVLYAGFY